MIVLFKNACEAKIQCREFIGKIELATRRKWNASKIAAILAGITMVEFFFAENHNGHDQKDNPNSNTLAVGEQLAKRIETGTTKDFTMPPPRWSLSANVWLSLIVTVLISCSSSNTKNNDQTTIIRVDISKSQVLDISERAVINKFILLETGKDFLISSIDKIQVMDSVIFIYDERQDLMFLFDKEGQFITNVGVKGRGPGEYSMINDVYIDDSEGVIYAHERIRNTIQAYDLSGSLINEVHTRHRFNSFCITNSGYWTYSCFVTENPNRYNLKLLDHDLNKMLGGFFSQNEFFPTIFMSTFFQDQSRNTYFCYPHSNYIYLLDDQTQTPIPHFKVDFGSRTIPYSLVAEMTDRLEYENRIYERDYLGDLNNFFFCENYFGFTFSGMARRSIRYYAWHDIESAITQVFDGVAVFKKSSSNPFEDLTFIHPIGVYNDELIYYVFPADMNANDLKTLEELSENADENSNPVLFFVRLN